MKKTITMIGIYPPPFGGISIHIKRLKELLEVNEYNVNIINEGSYQNIDKNIIKLDGYKNLIKILNNDESLILHFHTINKKVRSFLWLLKKITKKKIILTVHGQSLINQYKKSNFITKKLIIMSLENIDSTIFVDKNNVEYFKKFVKNKKKLKYINSFLLPNKNEENKYPKEVKKFLNVKEFKILVSGNIRFYKGKELYGISSAIESIYELKNRGFNFKLIIVIMDVKNQNKDEIIYYNNLKEKVKCYGLVDYVIFYEPNNEELWPLLEKVDLFIRPTIVDGFGVSIAESIYLNIPAISTNVCTRPNGTIVYDLNKEQLCDVIQKVFNNYNEYKKEALMSNIEDSSKQMINLYKNILEGEH